MSKRFEELVQLMARLRASDGCPWDRKQTHDSLKPYLLEETYEVLDTIDRQDTGKLKEELGDLLLQILFHAQIGTEAGTFTIEEVMRRIWPFYGVMFLVLMLVTYIPSLSLWLPRLLGL